MNLLQSTNRATNAGSRRGVAATELAVCMPVIILVVIATMEATAMIFLQQSVTAAAYEATRTALAPGASTADVVKQGKQILSDRGVKQGALSVSPGNLAAASKGTWIRVTASAPFKKNSLLSGWLFSGRTLQASVEMVKER
jgi:Flp pilus assembly protein TadG